MKTKEATDILHLDLFLCCVLPVFTLHSEELRIPYSNSEEDKVDYLVPYRLEFWGGNFISRLEFHSTNRFIRFELTQYWASFSDVSYNNAALLTGAFERAISDSFRDFLIDLPLYLSFEDMVDNFSSKLARFARKTFSGREEDDTIPSLFDKTRTPFSFRDTHSRGMKIGLRPFSADPNLFLGYVFDEHLRVQIRSTLIGLNHPKTELALQFLPSQAWSLGGGVVLEDKNIWKIDIFQDRDSSLKFFFFLNGSILGGKPLFRFYSFSIPGKIGGWGLEYVC